MKNKSWDRELYPALLITLVVGITIAACWRYCFDAPVFPACWFFSRWHIYCPACGGTRAMEALIQGNILQSLYWNPAVPIGAAFVVAYLISQTAWRLRKKRGWVLLYKHPWLIAFMGLMAVNCIVRNLIWMVWHIAL